MPDALSKTVPIWCAVINRAVRFVNTSCPSDWDTALYTPAGVVSPQEHHQIEKHLDDWARSLAASLLKNVSKNSLIIFQLGFLVHTAIAAIAAAPHMDYPFDLESACNF